MVTLILKPTRDNKGYRLKCRFKIEAHPWPERLHREKVRIAEIFVRDMHQQGWEWASQYSFTMKGPFPMVELTTLHPKRVPTAREMVARVARGERFLDNEDSGVMTVPPIELSEYWEYEISGVFVRQEILTERPDLHEEEH